jgi:hypothetical protein
MVSLGPPTARELPAFSTSRVPIDVGTRMFDAITTTVDRR